MSHGAPMIEVDGLWKMFGAEAMRALEPEHAGKSRAQIQEELGIVVALRNISLAVNEGEIFVVMGLSGSGKSTLVRCLTRLIEADQGQITYMGQDICGFSPRELREFRRSTVAMVFQHYSLLPHRRVMGNVAFGLEIRGMDSAESQATAAQAIATVGLEGWEDYYPHEMSGGMQQRVGLARALAVDPQILLMDEPFSGLDPLIRREMQDELLTLHKGLGKTIVFITHDLNEALKLGDRIAIMRDGEIIQEGTPEAIVTRPVDSYVTEFVQDVSPAKVIRARAVMDEAKAVVNEGDSPTTALQKMNELGVDSAFLVDANARLRGLLTTDEAELQLAQRSKTLKGASAAEAVTAGEDAVIESIIPMAARTDRPIAVVGADGRLLGEIHRVNLLNGMVSTG